MTAQEFYDRFLDKIKGNEHPFYYDILRFAAQELKPKRVLELGTGEGGSALCFLEGMPPDSSITTINWPNPPSGDDVGRLLKPYAQDKRLRQILGDTREVHYQINGPFDVMFVDSGTEHTCALVSYEWRLYEEKLADEAFVFFDDIFVNDMHKFWYALDQDKVGTNLNGHGFGIVSYRRKK